MVVDSRLCDQTDEIGRSHNGDKCSATFTHEDDVECQQGNGKQQLDAFVNQQPCEPIGLFVHVFLHQVAEESTQNHEEIGGHNHPVVPPGLVGTKTEQNAVRNEANQQEDRQIFCQHVVLHRAVCFDTRHETSGHGTGLSSRVSRLEVSRPKCKLLLLMFLILRK